MLVSPRRIFLPTSAAFVLACSGTPAPDAAPVAAGAPVFITGDGDTVRMREAARFGVLDGDEDQMLSNVNWLLATADGGVLLYDWPEDESSAYLRMYDSAGRFVRTVGRPGAGPGEYSVGPAATRLTDGSLLVIDQGLARITRFNRRGDLVDGWRGPVGMVDVFPANDGGWFVASVPRNPPDRIREILYWQYDGSGVLVDSIPAPVGYLDGPNGGIGSRSLRAMTIILPDGRGVYSRTDSIAFVVEDPAGPVRVEVPFVRARYVEGERETLRKANRAVLRRQGRGPGTVEPEIPEFKQAYRYLLSDPEGRLLFMRYSEAYLDSTAVITDRQQSPWRGTLQVDLFDSTTAYLGRLEAGRGTNPRMVAFVANGVGIVHEGRGGEPVVRRWVPERRAW